ncbi:hypothetical protein [Nonomuraea lactucae]|uniref:hypothetical protein n=1 Tax=Nonomuraea lactucae TaxID=2249762 RepID=UPI0013B45A0B|nr:hypothetical protein [Nonomuraea lactucae]
MRETSAAGSDGGRDEAAAGTRLGVVASRVPALSRLGVVAQHRGQTARWVGVATAWRARPSPVRQTKMPWRSAWQMHRLTSPARSRRAIRRDSALAYRADERLA